MSSMRRLRGFAFPGFVVLVSAILLAPALLASDPTLELEAWTYSGAPGCELVEGALIINNESSTVWYRISVTAVFHAAGRKCEDGDACGDLDGTKCECGHVGSLMDIAPEGEDISTCQLPRCRVRCDNHCDNVDCNNTTHCVTPKGAPSYTYLQWSENGIDWTDFEGDYTVIVGSHEDSNLCP